MTRDVKYTVGEALKEIQRVRQRLRGLRQQLGRSAEPLPDRHQAREQHKTDDVLDRQRRDPIIREAAGASLDAIRLAANDDIRRLYDLCKGGFGEPDEPEHTYDEQVLLHVKLCVKRLIGEAVKDGRATENALLTMPCTEFCNFVAAEATRQGKAGEPPLSRLPTVIDDPKNPAIMLDGTRHPVSPDIVLLFTKLLEIRPERVGLTKLMGEHPGRKIEALPPELQAIINRNHKGCRLTV